MSDPELDTRRELIDGVKATLGDAWDDLEELAKGKISAAVKDLAKLHAASLRGEDDQTEIMLVEAMLANWSFVGHARARRALAASIEQVAGVAGELLAGIGRRLIGG